MLLSPLSEVRSLTMQVYARLRIATCSRDTVLWPTPDLHCLVHVFPHLADSLCRRPKYPDHVDR